MSETKTKEPTESRFLTTPKGVARFPRLQTPDYKYKKVAGEYTTCLVVPAALAAPLVAKLEQLWADNIQLECLKRKKKSVKEQTKKPWSIDKDKDGNLSEAGDICFRFKQTAKVEREGKATLFFKPKIFMASTGGKPMEGTAEVGGGTEMQVSFEPRGYYSDEFGAGLQLALSAVMIYKFVEGGPADAGAYGFEVDPSDVPDDVGASEGTEAPKGTVGGGGNF